MSAPDTPVHARVDFLERQLRHSYRCMLSDYRSAVAELGRHEAERLFPSITPLLVLFGELWVRSGDSAEP